MPVADITKNKVKDKIKDIAIDKVKQLILPPKTTGEKLIEELNLSNFRYPWIMKIIGLSVDIFVIVVDSRYPTLYLSLKKVKNLHSTILRKAKDKGTYIDLKKFKYTPPILLDEFDGNISGTSIIIRVDIAGEMFMNKKIYESYIKINDKKIEVI